MIADETNFFIENRCPSCGGQLASNSHYLYELKAWCAKCERRFLLLIVGYKKEQAVFAIEREYH